MEKLAIEGGYPVRNSKIYYGKQTIEADDVQAVVNTIVSDYITCGPKVDELENELCKYTNAKYAVAVSNGTAALHCACIAAGIGPGDEVITTPITFAASANCVLYCGGKVVFADINEKTYNIDPKSIEDKITDKTKAIIAVDFTGQAVEIEEIKQICKKHNLIFIEDSAHSISTKYKGQQIGSLADMTTFSFHPVKTITGGEGGAILTNNEKLYKKLVLAHTHGITHDSLLMSIENPEPWYYEQIFLGYNYRITDFQAALITNQLSKILRFSNRRKEIVKKYNEEFSKINELIIPYNIKESDTCNHLYVLRLNLNKLKCNRKEFFEAMCAENIQPQIHYIPVYWFPYYQSLGFKRGECPIAEKVYESILSLPLYPKMTDKDVDDVIHAVKKVINYYRIVR
ncbi:MAG: UDP-4-amino-4,6-dideoxy-N-acetyl-beta-L-altrosamine transaminase [Coprobacillus cateniformis]|uniref:UDP-4-amino-4, 6-dideoxy-N-acetyl-beta-L-altrosamine transaminase n=1 Tax=Longibaculum muris TaxID=1796628 RepID=UPI003AB87423|nr:UDP-4-amino-4,6-dideoxy-N-acetyl-beta-L-altrosamine transaminase [Coprobacillus cateniformis]